MIVSASFVGSRPASASRLPGLDLLRAGAIGWVLLFHASLFGFVPGGPRIVAFGWMGVDLFFVLSGFLIAGQLLRPCAQGLRPDYRRFFVRRLLRTLPAYLVVVVVYFLLPASREKQAIQPLWQFLTFTENGLIDFSTPKAFSHVWSLCVEEQFYLAFPVAVALLSTRPSARKVALVALAALLAGMALRGAIWFHDLAPLKNDDRFADVYMERVYYPTWTRLDDLLAGVAAATVQAFRPRVWRVLTARSNWLLAGGIAGVVLSIDVFGNLAAGPAPVIFGYPLLALSMAMLVIAGSNRRSIIGRFRLPGAGALATGAYSLYLSHKLVFGVVQAQAWIAPSARWAVALAGALIVGSALYWLVERPFLRLRDRLDRRQQGHIPPLWSVATMPA